ncbi:MAG: carotenoid oxygenase family protein [Anaerolineales bacterium]|nr:carotenoid oxygenase family protein [Anaerolineales bacterium]
MSKQQTPPSVFKNIYPRFRYILGLARKLHQFITTLLTSFSQRPTSSPVIPDNYTVHNTSTVDSEITLHCLTGNLPADLEGSLYICQCLGSPEAFMVGDTNIIRIDFDGSNAQLTNRFLWTPVALARQKLKNTRHRFDFFGFMYLSPGLGMFSYAEGLYLLPDGRLAVTSDIDRPWIIERDSLRVVTPVGRRDEWLPMLSANAGEVMGSLFAGYNNSHVLYTDHQTNEVFMVNYQLKEGNGSEHPVRLMRWDGYHDFEKWIVVDHDGQEIEIKQSVHELIFTRDYILLADTAFVAGTEMFTPWKNAKNPSDKTVIHVIDRRDLIASKKTVPSKKIVVDKPCIHLIAEYENLNHKITVYMLHTPATNTAETIRSYDRDLDGNLFPKHLIGYGTLPVLDLSSIGKHIIDISQSEVQSKYISEMPYCWGPYVYTFMNRQIEEYHGQDLFVMFKGFSRDILPQRILNAYKNINARQVPLEEMIAGEGIHQNNSICRITTKDFAIADAYVFPDKVLLYTIAILDSKNKNASGYLIAGVVTDDVSGDKSSGHEYWIFNADDLAKGPICKLSHESLNNSTLFHTIYIPKHFEEKLNQKEVLYHVPIREDYPKEELKKWDKSVLECFEELIYPFFDVSDSVATHRAKEIANPLVKQRF